MEVALRSGGRDGPRVPGRPLVAHPADERIDAAAEREQEEHPSTLVRVLLLVVVLHALLEQVEDPGMLGPCLLHLAAQRWFPEPGSLRLLAGPVQALLEHPILHAMAGGLSLEACRGAVAPHRPGHAHRAFPPRVGATGSIPNFGWGGTC